MREIVPLIMSGGDPASIETLPGNEFPGWRLPELNLEQRLSLRVFATHFQYNMMPPSFFKTKPKVNLPNTLYHALYSLM